MAIRSHFIHARTTLIMISLHLVIVREIRIVFVVVVARITELVIVFRILLSLPHTQPQQLHVRSWLHPVQYLLLENLFTLRASSVGLIGSPSTAPTI